MACGRAHSRPPALSGASRRASPHENSRRLATPAPLFFLPTAPRPRHPTPRPALGASWHSHPGPTLLVSPRFSHTGAPIDLIQPATLRAKVEEPLLLLGKQRFGIVDIRVRCKGGGRVAQIYGACLVWLTWGGGVWGGRRGGTRRAGAARDEPAARAPLICLFPHALLLSLLSPPLLTAIRQAIAKGLVAFYQKCEFVLKGREARADEEREKSDQPAHPPPAARPPAPAAPLKPRPSPLISSLSSFLSPTFFQTSTRPPRRRSRTCWPPTTAPCWLPTLAGASPRSLAAPARAPASRSRTGERTEKRERENGRVFSLFCVLLLGERCVRVLGG